MKKFTDALGRVWTLEVTLGSALRVRERLGVDLLQLEAGTPPLLSRLGTDEIFLGEIICALLEPQFEAQKISVRDLQASFDGATMLGAQAAFFEALTDFFRLRGRKDRVSAMEKFCEIQQTAIRRVAEEVARFDVASVPTPGSEYGESPA